MVDLASLELRFRLAPWWLPVYRGLVFLVADGWISETRAVRWAEWTLDRALSLEEEP